MLFWYATADEQITTVQRQTNSLNLERTDIPDLKRILLPMHIIKINIRIFPIVSKYNKSSFMVSRESLIAPTSRVELDLGCLIFGHVEAVEHVVRDIADCVHED